MRVSYFGRLAARLAELGLNQGDLAYKLGLSHTAVSNRFLGRTPWDLTEIYIVLSLIRATPEEMHIYFPQVPQKKGGRTA